MKGICVLIAQHVNMVGSEYDVGIAPTTTNPFMFMHLFNTFLLVHCLLCIVVKCENCKILSNIISLLRGTWAMGTKIIHSKYLENYCLRVKKMIEIKYYVTIHIGKFFIFMLI